MSRQYVMYVGMALRRGFALQCFFIYVCSEGIEYEAFFPVRIDEMLRATHSLEQSLLEQKQAMKDRLQEILGLL